MPALNVKERVPMSSNRVESQSITVRDVTKKYVTRRGTVEALAPINLNVAAGEFVTIVGPSGCGKSTLLMIASGLEKPTSGEILVDGKDAGPPNPMRSVVFQQFALFPHLTVQQNIGYGLRMRGVRRRMRSEPVMEQIETMGLTGFENAYPSELSGGMQQRVAIARALVLKPPILLMDEPFGALDAQTRTVMQDEMARLRTELNSTIMFITHSVEEAVYLGDRIVVMSPRPGRISREITVDRNAEWKRGSIGAAMAHPEFNTLREKISGLLFEPEDQ